MSQNKKTTFTAKQLREHDAKVTGKSLVLALAVLMDYYDLEEADINRLMDEIGRYAEATKGMTFLKPNADKYKQAITIKTIAEIIEKKTGINMGWSWNETKA